jgi:hypothetical protein
MVQMNPILAALLGSAIRHGAQIVSSALVTGGLFTSNDASTVVGAVGIIGSFIWSQVDSWLKSQKIKTLKAK